MKTHLSDILIRLTVVTAMVMTALGALVSFAPASAAPVQGDGYWTDTFSDTTGITAPINISVSGGDVRLNTSSTIIQVPTSCNDATYPNAQNYEWYSQWTPPGSGTVTVTKLWYWQVDNSLSSSETIYMAMYVNGGGYTKISGSDATLKGTGAAGWISADVTTPFNITLGQSYWIGLASASGTSYGLARDNSANCANYPPTGSGSYYPTNNYVLDASVPTGSSQSTNKYIIPGITYTVFNSTGSLNSISISPSNLQSWGVFNATDNTTFCLPYRKAISITGTGTTLTDYQINISVSYVSGRMNSDFSDLRFKDSSGNLLSYWIESYVASTSAQVWVRVPSIAARGTTTIYMYYGNAAATSASNGSNTFIFFDDFSGGLGKWNPHRVYGTYALNSSMGNPAPCLELGGGIQSGNYGFTAVGTDLTYNAFQNGIIEADIYPYTDAIPEIIFRGVNTSNTGYKGRWDGRNNGVNESPFMIAPYSGWPAFGTIMPHFGLANQWQKVKLVINGSTFSIYSNGTLKSTVTNTSYAGPGEIGFANHFGVFARLDNIRVRQYASLEPTSSFSGEESGSYCGFTNPNPVTSITYKILRASDNYVLCTINAAQAAAGYDISSWAGSTSSIKLRAEFSTSNTSQTPILYDWRVTWTSVIQTWIDIQAPTNIPPWDLYPGIANNISGTLNVTVSSSSVNWLVKVNDSDTANTSGFMALLNGSSYNSPLIHLSKAMNVSAGPATNVTENHSVNLSTGGGIIAGGTGNASPPITFTQEVTWDDAPGNYQIVVTFTGSIY